MKIVVLSDCRRPTLPNGGHGLGRLAHQVARLMVDRGHDVELWAGPDSVWDGGKLVIHATEIDRAQTVDLRLDTVYLDCSHHKDLIKLNPDYKIVNYILDGECFWQPPNACVPTAHGKQYHPDATILPMGIDVDAIPFYKTPRKAHYLAFAAKIHLMKGADDALMVHQGQAIPVRFVGEKFHDLTLPDWRDTMTGRAFYDFVGRSVGLLHPLKNRRALGGGLMPLESAAMGVPSIVYDTVSSQYHVEHCQSGFIVHDVDEMIDAVQDLPLLKRKQCREWVADTHSLKVMGDALETVLGKQFESEASV